jgi:hypothetical protein
MCKKDDDPLIRACELLENVVAQSDYDEGQRVLLRQALTKIDQVVGEGLASEEEDDDEIDLSSYSESDLDSLSS